MKHRNNAVKVREEEAAPKTSGGSLSIRGFTVQFPNRLVKPDWVGKAIALRDARP